MLKPTICPSTLLQRLVDGGEVLVQGRDRGCERCDGHAHTPQRALPLGELPPQTVVSRRERQHRRQLMRRDALDTARIALRIPLRKLLGERLLQK